MTEQEYAAADAILVQRIKRSEKIDRRLVAFWWCVLSFFLGAMVGSAYHLH